MSDATLARLIELVLLDPTGPAISRARDALMDEPDPWFHTMAAVLVDGEPLTISGLDPQRLRDTFASGIVEGTLAGEPAARLMTDPDIAQAVSAIRRADADDLERRAGGQVDADLARRFVRCALPMPALRRIADRLDAGEPEVVTAILDAAAVETTLPEDESEVVELARLRVAVSLGPLLLRLRLRQAAAALDIRLREGDRSIANRDELDVAEDRWHLAPGKPLSVLVGPYRDLVGRSVTLTFGASTRVHARGKIDAKGELRLEALPMLAELAGLLGRAVDLRELGAGGMVFFLNLD